ncbi:hypothetical protein [Gloeobacter kilaueensis]|uniref:Uncharacterized protein n=1 Tax=Gloeobacter kilaueensis (strain ATCC BAA-2537 / CCAP 1431/1 / ULC 316 / JS1) TaxID=1183438 RepID=U5QC42_GLOK1|nr:hypothetical protein [Gloeobacter kilaueensis]AGY56416.1 hypothetical protein GKIL_0169 [Gloeobacter kilaueensis JS1]
MSDTPFRALLLSAVAASGFALMAAIVPLQASADPEGLCRDFPLNSRCNGGRQQLSASAPAAEVPAQQQFKIMLHALPGSSEWVRVEKQGNLYHLIHSRCLQSEITRLLTPFPPFYSWYDHPVTHVAFTPSACAQGQGQCNRDAAGDTLDLGAVAPTDGTFAIEYAEGGFTRSVTFKLPTAPAGKP